MSTWFGDWTSATMDGGVNKNKKHLRIKIFLVCTSNFLCSKQAWLWSEGERVRKRTNCSIPRHKFGIYSMLIKTIQGNKNLLASNTCLSENSEMRVKGISHKVDTLHLNDSGEAEMENNNTGAAILRTLSRALSSKNKKDRVDGITTAISCPQSDNDDEDEQSFSERDLSEPVLSRRRKSPNIVSPATTSTAAATNFVTQSVKPIVARRFTSTGLSVVPNFELINKIPISVDPLSCDRKIKKPGYLFESAQKPTIASTEKMHQKAIEKNRAGISQTQGDKLNQIKAMRRHHNSRSAVNTASGAV